MNFINVVGLISILFIAWLLSYHKRKINFRQIFWGIGLQFLFAVIVLKDDWWSFVGMGILTSLIIIFILKDQFKKNTSFKLSTVIKKYAGVLLLIGGVAYLIVNDLHGQRIFDSLSTKVAYFLSLSDYGAKFLFGNLADPNYFFPDTNSFWPGFGFQFAFKVLPTIIFFGGLMSVLYYFGLMQVVIEALSKFMRWTIGTSGAETLSCSANIFVGQTEAPLLIKPFLDNMTRSELLTIMVGGFATIAGGVLAGYIAMGIPAGHLIAASVMAAPGALVVGKIIYPELQHSQTAGDLKLPDIKVGENPIEAATNGITDGLKLAVNVGGMLIGFIALIAVADLILNKVDYWIDFKIFSGEHYDYVGRGMSPAEGEYSGYFPGSLRTLFGTVLRPIAFLMGVSWQDAAYVGNLIGIKLSLNEFVAYGTLTSYMQEGVLSQRAVIISTYALCGFANFASIGIQIGGISAISPKRKTDLAKIGLKAMFGGAIVSLITATIAGILLG
ncbi:MAG: NupC/NupG family nucleoside CNT transporter [Cytophagales bacterium]|nr:NupC/NupG family nucleoside CNT transporter [Cytophagales bacterium]